jgi:FtsP/CotA-like multicopper oxidase with cupredoxin domain
MRPEGAGAAGEESVGLAASGARAPLLEERARADILLDVSNPGRWMAHCHIAKHDESGMMFSFSVVGPDGG